MPEYFTNNYQQSRLHGLELSGEHHNFPELNWLFTGSIALPYKPVIVLRKPGHCEVAA